MVFLDVCRDFLSMFSRRFFKASFFEVALEAAQDPVANVRRKVCLFLPVLKGIIKMPEDASLLEKLKDRTALLMTDPDRDVARSAQLAAKELSRIQPARRPAPGRPQVDDEEAVDKLREQEEDAVKKWEEQEAEETKRRMEQVAERSRYDSRLVRSTSTDKMKTSDGKLGVAKPVRRPSMSSTLAARTNSSALDAVAKGKTKTAAKTATTASKTTASKSTAAKTGSTVGKLTAGRTASGSSLTSATASSTVRKPSAKTGPKNVKSSGYGRAATSSTTSSASSSSTVKPRIGATASSTTASSTSSSRLRR